MFDLNEIANLDYNAVDTVKPYAFYVCQNFLEKPWTEITLADFHLERIWGGQENYVFKCEIINDKVVSNNLDKPTKAILKIHGDSKRKDVNYVMKDNLVTNVISNAKMGPQLYGVFEHGRLEQYFPCLAISQQEMMMPKYSALVARAIAKFHSLKPPLLKNPDVFFNKLTKELNNTYSLKFDDPEKLSCHEKFMSYNLKHELEQLIPIVKSLNSPVVFCHNDICFGNILKLNDDELVLIDYEEGSYNYRGFDLGSFFSSWMFNSSHDEYPYFTYNKDGFPDLEDQLCFVNAYIDEQKRLNPKCENLDVDKLLLEARIFSLIFHITSGTWAQNIAGVSKMNFSFKDWAVRRCEAYFILKDLYFKDGFEKLL